MQGLSKAGSLFVALASIALALCVAPPMAHAANDSPADKASLSSAIVQQSSGSYKVAFKANGGKGSMKVQAIKRGKKVALKTNKFVRSGYAFAGWNTKKNGKGKSYGDKAKVKNLADAGKTVKLYAQWRKAANRAAVYTAMLPPPGGSTSNYAYVDNMALRGERLVVSGRLYKSKADKVGSGTLLGYGRRSFGLAKGCKFVLYSYYWPASLVPEKGDGNRYITKEEFVSEYTKGNLGYLGLSIHTNKAGAITEVGVGP